MIKTEKLGTRQEIRFNGEFFGPMIESGMKNVTIRVPKDGRSFEKGERVIGRTDTGDLDLVVLADEKMMVEEVPGLVAMSDGFLSSEQIIEGLSGYYKDVDWSMETEVEVIVFLTENVYEQIDEETRGTMLELGANSMFMNAKTRAHFLSAPAYWASEAGCTVEQWISILRANEIVPKNYLNLVVGKLKKEYQLDEVRQILGGMGGLAEVWGLGEGEQYEMMVNGLI